MDIQLEKSTIKRQIFDNFYQLNNTRNIVSRQGGVDIDALLNNVPGGFVLANDVNAVRELPVGKLPDSAFNLLEYEDATREVRSGVTRYNQGLDANSLNKTATGINIIQNAAAQRIELIARIFAETGILKLFRSILRLTVKNQERERIVRLNDEWVTFDPRSWNANMDVDIAVGLGAGTREAQAQLYLNLFELQKQVSPIGGASWEEMYNTLSRYVENTGLKQPDSYFKSPEKLAQAQQGQADPAMQAEQQAQQQAEADMVMKQQAEQEKIKAEIEADQKAAEADRQMKLQIEREKIAANERIKMAEINAKSQDSARMAEATSKPVAHIQFDAQGAIQDVANNLQALTVDQAAAIQASMATMQQSAALMSEASQAIAQALAAMSAPKEIVFKNGRPVGIKPVAM